jgi:hypothetical protein
MVEDGIGVCPGKIVVEHGLGCPVQFLLSFSPLESPWCETSILQNGPSYHCQLCHFVN